MSIARSRTIGLGLGLVFLAAVGAATLSRAQQPGDRESPPKTPRAELRERIVTLRAEVDVLQVEHDSDRGELKCLEGKYRRLALLQEMDIVSPLGKVMAAYKELVNIPSISIADSEGISKSLIGESKEQADALKKVLASLRGARDRVRAEFATKAKTLNEKKLDLNDAERQYRRSEAR